MLDTSCFFLNWSYKRGTCPVHAYVYILTGHLKPWGCRIDNDNNYTNDVNSGLLNSLSMLDLLLYGKWRLQVINFLEACCCLATWCQVFPPLCFTGHWSVSIDTIPASRSSKRLRELVSICMLRVKQPMRLCSLNFVFSVSV